MGPQHHIGLEPADLEGNDGLGRFVFLPGDPSRAERIAAHFEQRRTVENPRGFSAHLGTIAGAPGRPPIDVLALATGIGSASVEVVLHELIACGAGRLVRVGSCGTMVEQIRPGQVVIATGAVRDELTTSHYAPSEFPAMADPGGVAAMAAGARRAGLAEETFLGICHSKASLYGREFGHGPAGGSNLEYVEWLRGCGVIATEMEASTLFILAALAAGPPTPLSLPPGGGGCRAAAVLAVFGTDRSDMVFDPDAARRAEERAIRVALEGVRCWAEAAQPHGERR